MSTPLIDAFVEAQAFKHERTSSGVTDEMRRWVREEYERHHGDACSDEEVDAALSGMGWTLAMCLEFDLDFDELATVAESLTRTTRENVVAMGTQQDPIGLGVAAGCTTGLLIGLKLRQGRRDD